MPLERLTLETLKDLDDGRPAIAFEDAVAQAVNDCTDRPGNTKARTIALELKLRPEPNEEGQCDAVSADMAVKTSLPDRTTKTYSLGLNRKGHLIFSSTSPDNINQATFEDVDPKTGQIARGDASKL